MCGRYAFNSDPRDVMNVFRLAELPEPLQPRYNVGPYQTVQVVVQDADGTRHLRPARWGLLPHWAKSKADKPAPFNATAAKLTTSKMFQAPFARRRCLMPINGFFEWPEVKELPKGDPPYFLRPRDGRLLAFAAIWNEWKGGAESLVTVANVTTEPNALLAPFHHRSPVLIEADRINAWLDPATPGDLLLSFLTPFPADGWECYRAVNLANGARNEGPRCIEPLAAGVAH